MSDPSSLAPLPTPADGFDPAQNRFGLVIGHGRSGTNLALDLIDTHEKTVCRSELNRAADGSFSALPSTPLAAPLGEDFDACWAQALGPAPWRRWDRDRGQNGFKSYYRGPVSRWLAEHVLPRPRLRRAMGLRRTEWSVRWLHRSQTPVLPVFKLLLQPNWVVQRHADETGQHVVHVVRAPAGFVQSWRNRWVGTSPETVYAENLLTLPPVLAHFGRERVTEPGFSEAALVESELWRWRYMNEVPLVALRGSPRYRTVGYGALTADPAGQAAALCRFLGLPLDEAGHARAAAQSNTLFRTPHRTTVDPVLVADLAAAVLEGSPLRDLVASDETVAANALAG